MNTTYAYDPRFGSWTKVSKLKELITEQIRSSTYILMTLLFTYFAFSKIFIFFQLCSMNVYRSLFYVGVLGNHLYAVGGWIEPNKVTKSVEHFDPKTNTWRFVEKLPLGLHEHAGKLSSNQV